MEITQEEIKRMWEEAQAAGLRQLQELERRGPAYQVYTSVREEDLKKDKEFVVSEEESKKEGLLMATKEDFRILDLCGFAWVKIFKHRKIVNALKRISVRDKYGSWENPYFVMSKAYKGGFSIELRGGLTDSRQEISVLKAMHEKFAELLKQHFKMSDDDIYAMSRLD